MIINVSIVCLTLSAKKDQSEEYIISLADTAMYKAKEEGQDRVYVYKI